jgi:nucleoside-diphosphate-sugar epimerase
VQSPPHSRRGSLVRVFVTGGTGAIGGHTVPALITAGHQVTALARTHEKAATLTMQGATPVRVSLFDVSSLAAAFSDHDAVVNLASAIPPTRKFMCPSAWKENNRVRVDGSAAVVEAAMEAGIDRVVQESVSMLYPDRGSEWIDEDVATDRYPMAEANLAAEDNTNRFSKAGGSGVVLRLGWFYGPGATHSEEFFALARRHICISMGRPDSYVSSIHVADAGNAVVAALDAPAGTFNVVDDEPLTKHEYADALAKAVGKAAWLRLPGRAALLLGYRSTSLTRSLRVSNARFKTATRWAPGFPSAYEGWIATAQALNQRGWALLR